MFVNYLYEDHKIFVLILVQLNTFFNTSRQLKKEIYIYLDVCQNSLGFEKFR